MNTENSFDRVILGGGPAGTRAAFRATQVGMKTALVESGFLGGACLNVGCIPTKYLLGGTAALPLLAVQKKYKVAQGYAHISLEALQTRKDRYIKGTRQALEKQLREAGVTLFGGRGIFDGPQSLIIVGAGAIGLELGELFHRFGTKIILCDLAPHILPGDDPEISEAVHTHHVREGWTIHTGRRIESLSTVDGQSELRFADGERTRAAMSLVAVGRRSTASMLAPEKAGLALHPKGWLAVGADLRCAEHVYAAGDVNGRVLLAHAADHQARYAVDHAAGSAAAAYTAPPMPSCVYGSMELMRVGPTLKELQAKNTKTILQSRAALAGNAIAQSYGNPQGFCPYALEQ